MRGSRSSDPVTGWRPWPPWWASCWAGSCRAASPSSSGWPARSAQSLKPVPVVLNVLAQTLGHIGREGSEPVMVRLASAMGASVFLGSLTCNRLPTPPPIYITKFSTLFNSASPVAPVLYRRFCERSLFGENLRNLKKALVVAEAYTTKQ